MQNAAIVLMCVALLLAAYWMLEYFRTTAMARALAIEAVPGGVWGGAMICIVVVLMPTNVVLKTATALPTAPSLASGVVAGLLIAMGWCLLLSGFVLTWVAAHYNKAMCREARALEGLLDEPPH